MKCSGTIVFSSHVALCFGESRLTLDTGMLLLLRTTNIFPKMIWVSQSSGFNSWYFLMSLTYLKSHLLLIKCRCFHFLHEYPMVKLIIWSKYQNQLIKVSVEDEPQQLQITIQVLLSGVIYSLNANNFWLYLRNSEHFLPYDISLNEKDK